MRLTPLETLGIILIVAAGTQITRWLPFWLFPENKQPPAWVTDLGKVLPAATMGLLVVYCLKGVADRPASRRGGAAGHFGRSGFTPMEGERAPLHRRRHGAVHAFSTVGVHLTAHNFSSLRTQWRGGAAATSFGGG